MNKPGHFFGFLVVLALVVSGLSLLIGGTSVEIGDAELSYYSPLELFGPLWKERIAQLLRSKRTKL